VPMAQGLCGSTAATNTTLNTVDCCTDPSYNPLFDLIATCSTSTNDSYDNSSVVCMPIPPPLDTALTTDSAAKQSASMIATTTCGTNVSCEQGAHRPPCAKSTHASTAPLRPRLLRQTTAIKSSSMTTDTPDIHLTAQQTAASVRVPAEAHSGMPSQLPLSKGRATCVPVAVLQVCNKRGSEVFEQSDEMRLEVLCTEINELLRSRLVEVRTTHYASPNAHGMRTFIYTLHRRSCPRQRNKLTADCVFAVTFRLHL
jgi:hypothetical protein